MGIPLIIPYGLFVETFQRLKDDDSLVVIQNSPVARHPRDFVKRIVFVSVRDSLVDPRGKIVDGVFDEAAEGRVKVWNEDRDLESPVAVDYDIKIVRLKMNFDLLAFALACRQAACGLFGVVPGTTKKTILSAVEDLFAIWNERLELLAWPQRSDIESLHRPWLVARFFEHPKLDHCVARIPLLPGFADIARELNHDAMLTTHILSRANKTRKTCRIKSTDAEIVYDMVRYLSVETFVDCEKYLQNSKRDEGWYGHLFARLGSTDRVVKRLAGEVVRSPRDDTPWSKGTALLSALTNAGFCTGSLAERIYHALNANWIELECKKASNGDALQKAFREYMTAKANFAPAKLNLLTDLVRRHTFGRLSPSEYRPGVEGLLLAIDLKSENMNLDFKATLRTEVNKRLQAAGPPPLLNPVDGGLVERMLLRVNYTTGEINGEPQVFTLADDPPADDEVNGAVQSEIINNCTCTTHDRSARSEIDGLMVDYEEMTVDEQSLRKVVYRYLNRLSGDEAYAVRVVFFEDSNDKNMSPDQLDELYASALKKITRLTKRRTGLSNIRSRKNKRQQTANP